jgi:hypothetical protein
VEAHYRSIMSSAIEVGSDCLEGYAGGREAGPSQATNSGARSVYRPLWRAHGFWRDRVPSSVRGLALLPFLHGDGAGPPVLW